MGESLDLIVDDSGRRWPTGGHAIAAHFGAGRPNYNLGLFLVRNMGFARLRRSGQNLIVSFAPGVMSQLTFDAVCWLLVQQDPPRVALHTFGDTEGFELVPDLEEAILRIEGLSFGDATVSSYYEEELSLLRMREQKMLPLRRLLASWRASGGELPRRRSNLAQKLAGSGKLMMVRMERQNVLIHHVQGYNFSGPAWSENMIGRNIEEAPDPEYARSIATAYQRALTGAKPRLELVDATVRHSGSAPQRHRYDRLMLPWRFGNDVFVTTSSVARASPMMRSSKNV